MIWNAPFLSSLSKVSFQTNKKSLSNFNRLKFVSSSLVEIKRLEITHLSLFFQSWNGSKAEARLFFFALKIGQAASNNPSDEAFQDHQSRSFNANEAVEVTNNDSSLAFQCCNCSLTFFVHHQLATSYYQMGLIDIIKPLSAVLTGAINSKATW